MHISFGRDNGGGPGFRLPALRSLTSRSFEWSGGPDVQAWVWVAALLLATLVIPWPYARFQWPLLERAVPVLWLVAGGVALVCLRVSRASWPFAALIFWAGLRAMYHYFPLRSLQVLLLVLMAGLLYAAARDLTDQGARRAAYAVLVGVGFEGLLGALNAMSLYPWMGWIDPQHLGKPMGMLTHPNYWGSFMALGLPLVWAICGVPAAIVTFLLICRTISGGPVISAAVGALVMAWPFFGRRVRAGMLLAGSASVGVVMTMHEWRLSGRREVWDVALPEIMRWPILGEGLGQWRQWAEDYNKGIGKFFVTLQAHNEPLQLWFELGLIGVILASLWAFQAFLAAKAVWTAAPAATLPGPLWAWGRAPLERAWPAVVAVAVVNSLGSPVFHLPAQAMVAMLALARMQADAAAFESVPYKSTSVQRRKKLMRKEPIDA